ncbi:MAG: hypothetical protein HUU29_08650 [Planctomycetaceae bacterium]|nr:hypothetical protein [Planctomycetaceae bacterium]
MKRYDAVKLVREHLKDNHLVVICNGMIGREVWTAGDRQSHFYMIGSMGLASSIGMGLAQTQEDKDVVVIDGDGNVLMNMGTLGNIAAAKLPNFYHIVLDNSVHDSTGGQKTIADQFPLEQVAKVCGYARVELAKTWDELKRKLNGFFDEPGPAMLRVVVEPGNVKGIGRVEPEPPELARRFRQVATS